MKSQTLVEDNFEIKNLSLVLVVLMILIVVVFLVWGWYSFNSGKTNREKARNIFRAGLLSAFSVGSSFGVEISRQGRVSVGASFGLDPKRKDSSLDADNPMHEKGDEKREKKKGFYKKFESKILESKDNREYAKKPSNEAFQNEEDLQPVSGPPPVPGPALVTSDLRPSPAPGPPLK